MALSSALQQSRWRVWLDCGLDWCRRLGSTTQPLHLLNNRSGCFGMGVERSKSGEPQPYPITPSAAYAQKPRAGRRKEYLLLCSSFLCRPRTINLMDRLFCCRVVAVQSSRWSACFHLRRPRQDHRELSWRNGASIRGRAYATGFAIVAKGEGSCDRNNHSRLVDQGAREYRCRTTSSFDPPLA